MDDAYSKELAKMMEELNSLVPGLTNESRMDTAAYLILTELKRLKEIEDGTKALLDKVKVICEELEKLKVLNEKNS